MITYTIGSSMNNPNKTSELSETLIVKLRKILSFFEENQKLRQFINDYMMYPDNQEGREITITEFINKVLNNIVRIPVENCFFDGFLLSKHSITLKQLKHLKEDQYIPFHETFITCLNDITNEPTFNVFKTLIDTIYYDLQGAKVSYTFLPIETITEQRKFFTYKQLVLNFFNFYLETHKITTIKGVDVRLFLKRKLTLSFLRHVAEGIYITDTTTKTRASFLYLKCNSKKYQRFFHTIMDKIENYFSVILYSKDENMSIVYMKGIDPSNESHVAINYDIIDVLYSDTTPATIYKITPTQLSKSYISNEMFSAIQTELSTVNKLILAIQKLKQKVDTAETKDSIKILDEHITKLEENVNNLIDSGNKKESGIQERDLQYSHLYRLAKGILEIERGIYQ